MENDSPRVVGCVLGPVGLDKGEQGDLGHEAAPAEADDGELAPGDQLVGEGSADAEQRTRFGHAVDESRSELCSDEISVCMAVLFVRKNLLPYP